MSTRQPFQARAGDQAGYAELVTKSHGRRWYSMAVCRNREKSRDQRAPERSHGLGAGS